MSKLTASVCNEQTSWLNVQVCDVPHPVLIKDMLQHCVNGSIDEAYKVMAHLWRLGYSAEDIITIVFRVCKNHNMPEYLKLEFIKVGVVLFDNVNNNNSSGHVCSAASD